MHFSQLFSLLIQEKHHLTTTEFDFLWHKFKKIERAILRLNFYSCLQQQQIDRRNILSTWYLFQKERLQKAYHLLEEALSDKATHQSLLIKKSIEQIRENILKQSKKVPSASFIIYYCNAIHYGHTYIPFNQNTDPFKEGNFTGYCWGHSDRYAKLVEKEKLSQLSVASALTLKNAAEKNYTLWDILFRRRFYRFNIKHEYLEKTLWQMISKLKPNEIYNINYSIQSNMHSVALRYIKNGIEFYDSNKGLVQFKTSSQLISFLMQYLQLEAVSMGLHDSQIYLGCLIAYKNVSLNHMIHDPFSAFTHSSNAVIPKHSLLEDLKRHEQKLLQDTDHLAQMKAREIRFFREKFTRRNQHHKQEKNIKTIKKILANPYHLLNRNRGTGFYFFMSKFKAHSHTETLLQQLFAQLMVK